MVRLAKRNTQRDHHAITLFQQAFAHGNLFRRCIDLIDVLRIVNDDRGRAPGEDQGISDFIGEGQGNDRNIGAEAGNTPGRKAIGGNGHDDFGANPLSRGND